MIGDTMKMIGIIFSNIYDASLGELTKHRTLASLPFGGRYRLIDFVLSNMANANIATVGIITKYNYQSLMDHLGSCAEWDLNRKNGRVVFLPPFATGGTNVYRGKLEALSNAITFLKRSSGEYVLLSDSNNLCNIDYEKVLENHVKSGAKITVVANRETPENFGDTQEVVLNAENGKVTDIALDHSYTSDNLIGMGMYVVEKQFLLQTVEDFVSRGYYDFERDFLLRYFNEGKIDVNVYEFNRTVLRNRDIPSYFKNNCRLLEEEVCDDVFDPQNPIYTKVRDEVPSYYDENSVVDNCLVADGCSIVGTVQDSIISRNVVIEEGAVVKHSIVMQGTVVKKGADIEYCIIDKDVVISQGRTLVGAETAPVILQKGTRI